RYGGSVCESNAPLTSEMPIAGFEVEALSGRLSPLPKSRAEPRERKRYGGSVCESNAPLTSEMPIAGFEDRESHRTPFASAGRHYCFRHCKQLGAWVSRHHGRRHRQV